MIPTKSEAESHIETMARVMSKTAESVLNMGQVERAIALRTSPELFNLLDWIHQCLCDLTPLKYHRTVRFMMRNVPTAHMLCQRIDKTFPSHMIQFEEFEDE